MTEKSFRSCTFAVTVLSVVLFLEGSASNGQAQQQEVVEAGRGQYQQSCAVCHGRNGEGRGEMAKLLKVKPANLTNLSAKHDGIFPFWYVYFVIDGRQEVEGHGTREMPIWGTVFKQEAEPDIGAELQAYARILEIVYFIESLQKPTRPTP
jgi:mono/diheme cytochrome c family protein